MARGLEVSLAQGCVPGAHLRETLGLAAHSVYSGVSSLKLLRKQLCKERENIWVREGALWAYQSLSGCLQMASYFSAKGEHRAQSLPPAGLRASCVAPGPLEGLALWLPPPG